MVGRDNFGRRIHINFPFAPCYDGSLMFFRKFENESNDSFTLYFFDEEMFGAQQLIDEWMYIFKCGPAEKRWRIEKSQQNSYTVFNKKWVAKNIDAVIEDYNWDGVVTRVDHFYNVMPLSICHSSKSITFCYDYYTTDYSH